ncbi:MAG TPA: class I SAM-dependent methyltransferase [Anaerolineaceae bacterium]|nr:class I SAM-dependent methyltransferase [Anaerolineaceae bacterium]
MFLRLGDIGVPDRERQIEIIVDLIPASPQPQTILELGSGEGRLAEAILRSHPDSQILGLDGSQEMRQAARRRLEIYEGRFETRGFELSSRSWRTPGQFHAVVSSLVIHHLDGAQKQALYRDLYEIIVPGGALIIADLVQPASQAGIGLAANGWDAAVRQRSLQMSGNADLYEQFQKFRWNIFHNPNPMDRPSSIFEHLTWLQQAGFHQVDVYWMNAGHAIYGGMRPG